MSKNARVLRNIAALLVGQMGTWSATFILTLVVPSYLGARYYGLYSFVGTYTGFFGLGVVLGTGTFLTWRIAREPSSASRLLVNTLVMQVLLWAFWSASAVGLMPLMDSTALTRELTILSLIAMLFASLSSTCVSALAGFQIMRVPALIGVATALTGATGSVICVHVHANLIAFFALGVICQSGYFGATIFYTYRRIPFHAHVDLRLWPRIIAGGAPFFAWSIVLLFYWQVDVIMLKVMVGDAVVGWYSLANRVVSIPAFLPSIVVAAILPALSHEHNAESAYFRKLASRAIRLVAAVNIPASIGVIMLSSHVTTMLHFPGSFGQIAPLIVILSINMPLVALDMILGTILISAGRQGAWTWVGVIAGIINPLVNLWAIPFTQHMLGDGAIGAAVTTIQSELIMLCGAMCLRPKNVFTRWDVFYIFRCVVAAAIMVPAVAVFANSTSTISLLLSVCYGVLIYGLACYALRVVTEDDLRSAVSMVSAKLGFGNLSRAQLGEITGRLGLGSAQAHIRDRLVWARASVSRPIHSVSRPLAWGREVISQPLKQALVSIDAATSRYWSPSAWLEHEKDQTPSVGGGSPTSVSMRVHQPAQSSVDDTPLESLTSAQTFAPAPTSFLTLEPPPTCIAASNTRPVICAGEASSAIDASDTSSVLIPVPPEADCVYDGHITGEQVQVRGPSTAIRSGV